MLMRSLGVPVLFTCIVLAATFSHVATASAQVEFVDVPAVGFPLGANTSYLASSGVVEANSAEVLRAAVRLRPGFRICRLIFWAHDFDVNDVTVNLVRKSTAVTGTFGPSPEVIGSASSSGAADTLRIFTTSTFSDPVITSAYFYWVELDFGGGPIQVTGVRIRTASTC